MTQSDKPHVLLAHAIGYVTYGTLDRNRAAFIQAVAEKDAAQIQYVDIADAQG